MTHLLHQKILGGATLAALAASLVTTQVSARDEVVELWPGRSAMAWPALFANFATRQNILV